VFDPMEFSLMNALGARAMQTDFGGWGYCPPPKPSYSKRVSGYCRKSSHGVRAYRVRSTCAAVGSLRLATVGAGPMTRLGYSSKVWRREELNHERPARA